MLRPSVTRLARLGVRPNQLTVAAIVVSAAAGGVTWLAAGRPGLLWLVPVFYLTRMAANAMDGLLAREHSMQTRTGAALNEIGDVISDAMAYLPFAILLPELSGLVVVAVVIGLIAEVAALVSGPEERRNDGPLGKSDRALGFGILAVLAAGGADRVLAPVLVLMVLLGLWTVRNRTVIREVVR